MNNDLSKKIIVFLHIPKTAGQTIHSELSRELGEQNISPVRVHTQVDTCCDQFPLGYHAYSGHLDWDCLNVIPKEKFVFTVFRDPLERLASFYLYLKHKSMQMDKKSLNLPNNTGLRMISELSADQYFFKEEPSWQRFIQDHYFNPYCSYLVTKKIRGNQLIKGMHDVDLIDAAMQNTALISQIYSTDTLSKLEYDIKNYCGLNLQLVGKRVNKGPKNNTKNRWSQLSNLFENKNTASKLMEYT
ncbi:sulfotransferase family protein, partial [Amylibacter sp.]|nr:sulfotransferase family protein [Amylibacter sp.]